MLAWFSKAIPLLFNFLFLFVPLVLFPKTSEIFEFNKMVATYALTLLIVVFWLVKMVLKKKIIFRRTILDIPLIIFIGSQLLSTITSIDPRTSIFGYYSRFHGGLLSSISYSLLYWAFVSNMDREKTIKSIKVLFTSAVLVSIYGVLEHFGIDKEIWVQDVQNRVFSTLGQPNWLAAWLAALIPLTWAWAISADKDKKFWLSLGLSTLFFLTLLYTKSRSGLLGFVVAEAIFWPLAGWVVWKKEKIIKSRLLKAFVVCHLSFVFIAAASGTPWTPSVGKLLQTKPDTSSPHEEEATLQGPALEVGGTESGKIRKIVWKGAVDIWKNYPILGTGVETFAYSYYNFRPEDHNLVSEWDFLYNKAHNEYLNIAATTGTLGLLSCFILIGTIAWQIIKESDKKSDIRYFITHASLLAGFTAILVTNFFGFSVVPVGLQYFLYPAMAVTLARQRAVDGGKKAIKRSMDQNILLAALLFTTGYLLLGLGKYWYADILYAKGKLENDSGNYRLGQEALLKATKLSPKEAIIWDSLSQSSTGIAQALWEEGDIQPAERFAALAISESDKAANLSPANVNLKRLRASMFIQLSALNPNYLVRARETLLEAVRLAPTEAKLHYNLALVYVRTGEPQKAIELLEKTIEMKANYRNARFAYALLLIDEGEIQKAKEELEYILQNINPKDALVKQELEEIGH